MTQPFCKIEHSKKEIMVYDDKIDFVEKQIKELDEEMKEGNLMIKLAELQRLTIH